MCFGFVGVGIIIDVMTMFHCRQVVTVLLTCLPVYHIPLHSFNFLLAERVLLGFTIFTELAAGSCTLCTLYSTCVRQLLSTVLSFCASNSLYKFILID